VSTDVGYELGAALRSAADGVEPPFIDLAAIKRGGRRRRYRARAAATIVVVFVAGFAGVLFVAVPSGRTTPPVAGSAVRSKTIAHVRAFYHDYALAQVEGPASVNTLVRSYTAVWYTPILQVAATSSANPVGCAEHDLSATSMAYEWIGVLGGQAVVLARWRTAERQLKYNVVSTTPRTAAITGITCVSPGYGQVTSAARNAPVELYTSYVGALQTGVSPATELVNLRASGRLAGSPYLTQFTSMSAIQPLGYDPVLCASGSAPARGWSFSVARRPKIVAGGSAALVLVRPRAKAPILTVVQREARGLAVTDIACQAR
jgi:hypothetical protein